MTEKPLSGHLQDYYERQSLPESTARRLAGMTEEWDIGSRRAAQRTSPGAHRVQYALAASIALLAAANLYWAFEQRALRLDLTEVRAAGGGTFSAPMIQTGLGAPRLAAVQTVMANCPQCPTIRCVFRELAAKNADQPILFLTADLTNEQTRQQWEKLAGVFGMDWVTPQCGQSGVIQVADLNEKRILGKLTRREEQPELEKLLKRALASNQQ